MEQVITANFISFVLTFLRWMNLRLFKGIHIIIHLLFRVIINLDTAVVA